MGKKNIRRFHWILIFGIISCCAVSCHIPSRNDLYNKLCKLELECGDTITVDLSTLVGVEFDDFYVFGSCEPDWYIKEKSGLDLSGVPDDAYRLILLKNNQIVYDDISRTYSLCCIFPEYEGKNKQLYFRVIHRGYELPMSVLPDSLAEKYLKKIPTFACEMIILER